jgi:trigger factor
LVNNFEGIKLEHVIKNLSACERELEIKVSASEFKASLDKAFAEAAPKIDLKGFRKGKAPMHLIKKMFGEQIENDAQVDCGNTHFQKITSENNIHILSAPFFKDIKKTDEGLEFIIGFETMPAIELGDYRAMAIKEPIHRVQEDEIEHQLQHVLMQNGTTKEADEVKGDYFYVNVKYSVEDKENPENNGAVKEETFELFLHDHRLPVELAQAFNGKKVGDVVEFNPEQKPIVSKYEILGIKEIVPMELKEENIKKLSQDRFDNAEDFKQEIGFQIQEMWDAKSREAMEEEVIDKLVEMHDFELPPTFYRDNLVRYTIDFYKNQKVELKEADVMGNIEMFDKYFGDIVSRLVRWTFLSEMISVKEKIEIEENDIDEQVDQFSGQFPGIGKDQLKSIMLKNDEFKATLLRKKLMDLLMDFSTTEEVDFEQFMLEKNAKAERIRQEKFEKIQEEIKAEESTEAK